MQLLLLLFLYMLCLGVLHIISLYALSLHNSAHLQVPWSLHVRQNKEDHTFKTITLILL